MLTPPRKSRRRASAEEKRRAIFDAARDVILRRGYDAATMEDISIQAGVGKGTLYNFFSSKEDLFLSLVLDGFNRIREVIEAEVGAIPDPWERFSTGWRTLMIDVFPELNRRWAFIYQIWGLLARDEDARERMFAAWRKLYRDREEQIARTIAEGQRLGQFGKGVRPKSVGLLLMAVFDGLLHRAMFDPQRVEPEEVLADILDMVRLALAPDVSAAASRGTGRGAPGRPARRRTRKATGDSK